MTKLKILKPYMLQTGDSQAEASPQLRSLIRFVRDNKDIPHSRRSQKRMKKRVMEARQNPD